MLRLYKVSPDHKVSPDPRLSAPRLRSGQAIRGEKAMSDFVRLCSKADLPEDGEAKEIPLGDKVICVANVSGTISAMDNVCLHRGGPIGQGVIADNKVVCPWHGWMWDPKTGQAEHNPEARVAVYPIKLEGDEVYVQI